MNTTLKTVELQGSASLIEVSRRIHAAGTRVLRAIWRKTTTGSAGHWAIQYSGAEPDLYGLAA